MGQSQVRSHRPFLSISHTRPPLWLKLQLGVPAYLFANPASASHLWARGSVESLLSRRSLQKRKQNRRSWSGLGSATEAGVAVERCTGRGSLSRPQILLVSSKDDSFPANQKGWQLRRLMSPGAWPWSLITDVTEVRLTQRRAWQELGTGSLCSESVICLFLTTSRAP